MNSSKAERARPQPEHGWGVIYFIENKDAGAVKIGFTRKCVQRRLAALQTGSPSKLTIAATIEGSIADEARLHAIFEPLRLVGEWFRRSDKLCDMVAYLEQGASFDSAMRDCVATPLDFPWRDLDALERSADLRFLPQWCLDELRSLA